MPPYTSDRYNIGPTSSQCQQEFIQRYKGTKLKGTKNDPEEIKNYRPIANLKFFAKIVEKVAALQLQEYLKNCNLHAKSQSGYRSFHIVLRLRWYVYQMIY